MVGEIGVSRHEFLYQLRHWEVRRIIKGYRRRHLLTHQLLAEVAYATTFSMKDPKGKTIKDMYPALFEDEDDDDVQDHLTEEDRKELQQLIDNYNNKGGKK